MLRHRLVSTIGTSCCALVLLFAVVSAAAAQSQIEDAVANLEWREIGPTIMSGRISDLAVVESNPSVFYVGTASGGVWKTVNHGTTFESLFTDEVTSSIGDVTLAPSNPNVVWVGTGEPQNRQSSPWGNGVYRSTDAGRTWVHKGLADTHHISRIVVHPLNPDVAYVAAVGHLWGPNTERGVYKTVDGGDTWEHVLYVDEFTGAVDMVMDHGDPQTLFAAMYQRQRTGWGFNGGGPGSGIYRSTDGGVTWTELTEGLPEGDKGRIGLDISRANGNVVYALVEADARRPGQSFGGGNTDGKNGVYRSTDRGETWERVSNTNNRPMYYSQIRIDPTDPERIYLGGARLYRSSDGGKNFTSDAAAGVHLDHHALWIDPANSDHMILGSDGGVSVTWDRGENWRQLRNLPVSQFYQIGVDMRVPYHVCGGLQDNGSWCAPSDTWSNQGIRTRDWYNIGSGDGFFTVMHPDRPGMVLAESQGGNLARVNLQTKETARLRPIARPTNDADSSSLRWNWDSPIVWSVHDASTVYIGGNMLFRSRDLGQAWEAISPDLTKAIDRQTLEIMGVDGSKPMISGNDGTASYGNLTTVSESPLDADLIYIGTDDGNVHVTRNGGADWIDITDNVDNLPDGTYVSRVVASRFDVRTVYATFDGHRNDDFDVYVYRSNDFGENWRRIVNGLPMSSVNVIVQHPRTDRLLFVGNEIGVYVSVDEGMNWSRLKNNLPTVPVDDIVVHPRDNDLVIGTHGRGIWIMADISPLEGLTQEVLASDTHIFPVRRATSYNRYTPQGWTPSVYAAENPQVGALIRYYLRTDIDVQDPVATDNGTNGDDDSIETATNDASVKIVIMDADGETVRELEGSTTAGVQEVVWDLRIEPPYETESQAGGGGRFGGPPVGPRVLPGTYAVRLEAAGRSVTTEVEVVLDPRVVISRADLLARQDALMSAYQLAKPVYESGQAVRRMTTQLSEVKSLAEQNDDVPEDLLEQVDTAEERIEEIGREINRFGAAARRSVSMERSTTKPSADQLWQLERAWEKVPELISELNGYITDTVPGIYQRLNELGILTDSGEPVVVPRRAEDGGR